MKITLMVEGATEKAFLPTLREFLKQRLAGKMPKLDVLPYHGRIPKGEKLRREVGRLLSGKFPADAVIALTDVYTGCGDFASAQDAKEKMRQWVGREDRFHPHVALHDFEAWLLPYWEQIQALAGSNRKSPGARPEQVNHQKPPAAHLKEVFLNGSHGRSYSKVRDGTAILRNQTLDKALAECAELRALVNTVLQLCGGALV